MSPEPYRLEDSISLVDCAMGRKPADLVIRDGRWVCVQTGEIIPHTDIAVFHGRIAYVGPDASHTIGSDTIKIAAENRFMTPGLLDAHMHVESGMVTVTEFVRAVAPHGTTGIFIDPHEIANVCGLPGVRLMVEEAALQPIHVWVEVPSCVPSSPDIEISSRALSPDDVAEALQWPGVIGLGEVMDFPAVSRGDKKIHAELVAARQAGKVIGGHYASPDLGLPFHGYAAGGIEDDHEGVRLEDAIERARQGIKVIMRYGSAWHDVAEQVRAITESRLDPRHFLLCTDDSHSETLVNQGHMDRVIRFAISQGLPPITALQMATINTAEHFGLGREMGQIAPGRSADILLVKDLAALLIEMVIARGQVLVEDGQVQYKKPSFSRPAWIKHTVHLARALTASDFHLPAPRDGEVTANVIGVIENQAPTRGLRLPMSSKKGEICPDLRRDIAKLAFIDRQNGNGRLQVGLVQGFGFNQPCAVATTVVHDSHQLLVAGTDEASMAVAANTLAAVGGGQVVVLDGKVIGLVELPVGGLMSELPVEEVALKAADVLNGFKRCGCQLNNPNMQLSLLALVVIPELRLSEQGLVDVARASVIPVIE